MIDYILASPAMARGYVSKSYLVVAGDRSSLGSDHCPVSAEFKIDRSAQPPS